MNSGESINKICKIVYFDENSVTDYVQIVAGGELQKTTELFNQTSKKAGAGASATVKGGISGIFKALLGFEAAASIDASADASINTGKMAKNIVKNTILTDFIDLLEQDVENKNDKGSKGAVRKFKGYTITAEKDSLSYIIMVSPYLTMLKGGSGIPAGDFNIAVEKLDNAIKSGKGYYEFVGTSGQKKVILRFNINSFKNNYKITDLLKMDLSIYAIKVGITSIDKLNFNNELDIDLTGKKDNPSYRKDDSFNGKRKSSLQLEVYDVLLAGVETDG